MKLAMHRTDHQVQPAQDLVRKIQTPIFENVHLDSLSERSSGGCSVAGQQHHSVKLGWLSDIHLNFLGAAGRSRFFDDLPRHDVDAWILSGDIGDARTVIPYLEEFEQLPARIFFVLGNHDFYHGSIRQVSANVRRLCADNERLVWLTDASHVELGDGTAIIGDDGWSDGRLGNAISTPVDLNDFHLIEELEGHDRQTLVDRLNRLGDEAAERLRPKLLEAAARHATVLVVTHSPPFDGATWHERAISSPDFMPWFSWAAGGDVILEAAEIYPLTQFLAVCGHTHSSGSVQAASEPDCPHGPGRIRAAGAATAD